jgi:GMP synthase-like glutamine amidotransferase
MPEVGCAKDIRYLYGSFFPPAGVGTGLGLIVRVLTIQADEHADLGLLRRPLLARGAVIETWFPRDDPRRPRVDQFDAVIALGSAAHPDGDSEHAWVCEERLVLQQALDLGVSILGICFGAQLLAQAAGGSAGRLATPEIGWHEVRRAGRGPADPLLDVLPRRFWSFQWHEYGFHAPPEALVLASSGVCPQAFRIGRCAWGLQFHIEASRENIATWIRCDRPELVAHGVEVATIWKQTLVHSPVYESLAEKVANSFVEVVQAS